VASAIVLILTGGFLFTVPNAGNEVVPVANVLFTATVPEIVIAGFPFGITSPDAGFSLARLWRMSFDWLASVVPVVLGIGGFFAGGYNERLRDERTFQREKATRDEQVRVSREDERHQFQLENYLALQDAALELMRSSVQLWMHDLMTLRETGKFSISPPELSERALVARTDYRRLMERVLNDELRAALSDLSSLTADATMQKVQNPPSATAAEAELDRKNAKMGTAYEKVSNLLGARLREELNRAAP